MDIIQIYWKSIEICFNTMSIILQVGIPIETMLPLSCTFRRLLKKAVFENYESNNIHVAICKLYIIDSTRRMRVNRRQTLDPVSECGINGLDISFQATDACGGSASWNPGGVFKWILNYVAFPFMIFFFRHAFNYFQIIQRFLMNAKFWIGFYLIGFPFDFNWILIISMACIWNPNKFRFNSFKWKFI